jgi:RNase H-like domain found in reverse transcriptase
LLRKSVKFEWTTACDKSFNDIKEFLSNSPVVAAPNFEKPSKLAIDAIDYAVGSVLLQDDENSIEHPIACFSKKLNSHQKNYSTIEKETLSLVFALQHFDIYVNSEVNPLLVYTDYNTLTFVSKLGTKNPRILRWC